MPYILCIPHFSLNGAKNSTPDKSDVLPKNEIKLSLRQLHLLTVRHTDKKTYYVIIA